MCLTVLVDVCFILLFILPVQHFGFCGIESGLEIKFKLRTVLKEPEEFCQEK